MGERQFINLPFAEGLAQQEAIEWQDSGASASGVNNGNFTKQGAVDKRLGMQNLPNTLQSGGNAFVQAPASGLRVTSWTRSGLSMATPGALYSYSNALGGLVGVGPLPPASVSRTPITTATASSQNACVVLVPYNGGVVRLYMFVTTNTSGQWVVMLAGNDAYTGDVAVEPQVLYNTSTTGAVPQAFAAQLLYNPNNTGASTAVIFCFTSGGTGTQTARIGTYNLTTNTFSIGVVQSSLGDIPDLAVFEGYANGAVLFTYLIGSYLHFTVFYVPTWSVLSTQILYSSAGGTYGGGMSAFGNVADTYILVAYVSGASVMVSAVNTSSFVAGAATVVATLAPAANVSGITRFPPASSTPQGILSYWSGYAAWPSSFSAGMPLTASGHIGFISLSGSTPSLVPSPVDMPAGMVPTAAPFVPYQANFNASSVLSSIYQPVVMNWMMASSDTAGGYVSEQGTCYLLQYAFIGGTSTQTCLPCATVAPRQVDMSLINLQVFTGGSAPGMSSYSFHCPHVSQYPYTSSSFTSGTWFSTSVKTLGADLAADSDAIPGDWAVDWKFDSSSQSLLYQPGELGSTLHLSGAVPFVCDGDGCYESSFFSYPEFPVAQAVGTAGGETRQWAIVVAYTDAAGNTERGAPTFTNTLTTANLNGGVGASANILIPPVCSWRQLVNPGSVYAEIYRTTWIGGVQSTSFYLVDRTPLNQNVLTVYSDTTADSGAGYILADATLLYTTGGVLDGVNPPSFSCQVIHKNRVWGVDETGENIWFTKAFTPGLAPTFHEALTISFSDRGAITGLWSMDDKLIVGKASGLWIIYGDGPADTGQGNDLTIPQPVACDSGPVDWRSGVVFPGGFLYRSATGFMLCDRSLNVSWIGKDVVDSLASFPTVLSATVVPRSTQVRFVCTNAFNVSAVLVFDYLVNKWITHTYPFQSAGVASATMSSLVSGNPPAYATVTFDGNLWLEQQPTSSTAYFDYDVSGVAHFNPTTVTTAWTKLQGVQGYQRARQVQAIWEESDDCGFTMGFAVNYLSTIVQTASWPSVVVDQLPGGAINVVQQHVAGAYMKQMALQVTVSDTAGTNMSNGKGARYVGLSLELEAIGGRFQQVPVAGKA